MISYWYWRWRNGSYLLKMHICRPSDGIHHKFTAFIYSKWAMLYCRYINRYEKCIRIVLSKYFEYGDLYYWTLSISVAWVGITYSWVLQTLWHIPSKGFLKHAFLHTDMMTHADDITVAVKALLSVSRGVLHLH